MGGDASGGGVGGTRLGTAASAARAVVVGPGAVGLDALGDEGGGGADDRGGLALRALHDAVVAGAGDLVAEARDEAVDHRAGEDGQQDDGEAGDDGGERVGAVLGRQGAGQAEHYHDDGLHQDDRDHDARPAADVAPQVLVDEPGVHDRAEQRAHVEEGGADHQLQPEHAGGEDGDEGDDDQHDRPAADVLALFQGSGEVPEERVRLVAGGLGQHVRDAVGRGDDGVEDQRGERRGQDGQPEEADRLGQGRAEGDAPHGALGHGEQPQQQGQDRRRGEDDGVLLQERGVGEVDVRRALHGVAELVDRPGRGVGAALGQGGEGVERAADGGTVGAASAAASAVVALALLLHGADDEPAVVVTGRRRRRRRCGDRAGGQQDECRLDGRCGCGDLQYAAWATGHT